MGWRTLRTWLLPAIGLISIVVGVVLINQHATIQYPLGTWRMDLDDALTSIALLATGVAAIWTVWLKATEADRKATKLEEKLNGGLQRAARQHMQENEVIIGLNHRMDRFETERDDCRSELADLREWVIERFDQNGLGRQEPR